jgi:hypothetical protein
MPDSDGILSQEEMKAAQDWLTQKGALLPCPACQNPSWTMADRLVLAPVFNPAGRFVVGAGFPGVMVMCNRCTYYRLHSAVMIGLVAPEKKVEEAKHGA